METGERGIVLLVAGGLVASTVLGVLFPLSSPGLDASSMALGSNLILAVQRVIFLFAAWLLIVVILVMASQGRLPVEISGRGLRYADTVETQSGLTETAELLRRLNEQVDVLDRRLAAVETESTCKRCVEE